MDCSHRLRDWCVAATRVVSVCALLVALASRAGAQQPPPVLRVSPFATEMRTSADRFTRLERYLVAVGTHRLGESDVYSQEVARWSLTDLQYLWVDAQSLAGVMRDQRFHDFRVKASDGRFAEVIYSRQQTELLKALSCAAGGYLDPSGFQAALGTVPRECIRTTTPGLLSAPVSEVALFFGRERVRRGDDNLFWRRAALLHSDIAMLERPVPVPLGTESLPIGPRRTRFHFVDGRAAGLTLGPTHWAIAEAMLGYIKTAAATKPDPARDPMVRDWYRATQLWLQSHEQHDPHHLEAGLALFPGDAVLLFLSGCEHEGYAAPSIQAALEGTLRRPDDPQPAKEELRRAVRDFRKSLEAEDSPVVRSHLGRVLALLDTPADAIEHLTAASSQLPTAELRYLNELFLGQAQERAGLLEAAADAYQRAHALYPSAQTPLLAASSVARRMDSYAQARQPMAQLWALDATKADEDPWWDYAVSHTRTATTAIARVWEAVR